MSESPAVAEHAMQTNYEAFQNMSDINSKFVTPGKLNKFNY